MPQLRGGLTQCSALSGFVIIAQRTQIAELAIKNRLPAIYHMAGICGSTAGS